MIEHIELQIKKKVQKRQREYADTNRERIKAYQAEYRRKNKEQLAEYKKQYHIDNREADLARSIKWQTENRERHNQHVAAYAKRKPEIAAKASKKHRKSKLSDLDFLINEKFLRSKYRAKNKGWEFDLTLDYLHSIYPSDDKCPIFGTMFDRTRQHLDQVPSIDRIDNNKGYVQGNVWFISYRANIVKRYMSVDELKELIERRESQERHGKPAKVRCTSDELRTIVTALEDKIKSMQ